MAETGRLKATVIGLSAVLMWATLGLFGAGSGNVPPFLLNTLCFGFSGTVALIWLIASGKTKLLRQPLGVWAFGTIGLFGFHFFYFTAIRNAPPVEANLINYTWPLLIVLFSALLPGETLRLHHIVGTVLGLAGAVLLITGGEGIAFSGGSMLGYAAAVTSSLFWSSYSVLSRRLGAVPTEAVAGFLPDDGAPVRSVPSSRWRKRSGPPRRWNGRRSWRWQPFRSGWPSSPGISVSSVVISRCSGAAAYSAPLLSTLLLIAFGFGALTWSVGIACVAITLGAVIAAKDMIFKSRQKPCAAPPNEKSVT